MFTRTLTTLVALMLASGNVFSQQSTEKQTGVLQPTVFSQHSRWNQTGVITLKMSGELAREYAIISDRIDVDEILGDLSISTNAVIAQRLDNEQVKIEHSAQVTREGRTDRLVTLTATVDEKKITSLVRTVYEGTFTFSNSPLSKEVGESPTVNATHFSVPFLSMAELKGVEIRSWTLESEIGE